MGQGLFFCLAVMCTANYIQGSIIPGVKVYDQTVVRNKRQAGSKAKNKLTVEERIAFINAHNSRRSSVSPSAANMRKIYYSSEIEIAAQSWSNKCLFKHGFPDLSNNRYKKLGQNIWMGGGYTPDGIVGSWYSEVKDYTLSGNKCASGQECGHYTQVVWFETYLVGCGITYCDDSKNYIAVCNYYIAGNLIGKPPYTSGGSCSSCPAEASECTNNLCGVPGNNCSAVELSCPVTDETNCLCADKYYSGATNKFFHPIPLILATLFCIFNFNF